MGALPRSSLPVRSQSLVAWKQISHHLQTASMISIRQHRYYLHAYSSAEKLDRCKCGCVGAIAGECTITGFGVTGDTYLHQGR